jgi:TrwC relaxase
VLRVTTLYAGSAAATARYYTQYLTAAPGEEPGRWLGAQARGLNLSGDVTGESLELLLTGRDPTSGTALGNPLLDRYRADGSVVRAVAGFGALSGAAQGPECSGCPSAPARSYEPPVLSGAHRSASLPRRGSGVGVGRVHVLVSVVVEPSRQPE